MSTHTLKTASIWVRVVGFVVMLAIIVTSWGNASAMAIGAGCVLMATYAVLYGLEVWHRNSGRS